MINSHYVPQFILRNFYSDDKITYCDLEQKTIQPRNTRSVFSEEGYYPEEIERDLSKKAEYQFANLFHNKMENARNSVSFTADELFIIKKFLIVSAVRYKHELSEEEKALEQKLGSAFKRDYDRSIKDILACSRLEDVLDIMDRTEPFLYDELSGKEVDGQGTSTVQLWSEIRDIIYSYLIFVKPKGDERFLIPDVGRGTYQGPLGLRKVTSVFGVLQNSMDLRWLQLLHMISPRDYTVYPLSRNLAIITMDSFYKIFTKSEFNVKVKMPDEYPTLSSLLAFGNSSVITPPKVSMKDGTKEYKYNIKKLGSEDICHFNSLMLSEANRYIACADLKDIQGSIELAAEEYTDRDLLFMKL